MQLGRGRVTTNVVAVLVIVALLGVVGIPFGVILIGSGFAALIWLAADRSRQRSVEKLFLFYVEADAILREEERRWYGFEIAETIDKGEELLDKIPDSPPLQFFALGALHFKLNNHSTAAEYLGKVMEDKSLDEGQRRTASPQLRSYVNLLRRIEAEPSIAPQALGAIRNLERLRDKKVGQMLLESRNAIGLERLALPQDNNFDSALPLTAINTPPSISEVLHNVYPDES
jgi:hypothetical protein